MTEKESELREKNECKESWLPLLEYIIPLAVQVAMETE